MTRDVKVAQVEDTGQGFVFEASVGTHTYRITLSRDYYLKLTGGRIPPGPLVDKSIEFLLDREGPGSILPEFDLSLISHYFPEYEESIRQLL